MDKHRRGGYGAIVMIWRRQPVSLRAGSFLLALLLTVVVFAPFLSPFDPIGIDMAGALHSPDGEHPLGTDQLGRDVLSRVAFGARLSILVGVAAVMPATVLGITLGVIAGYFGGWVDELLMRITDIFLAFPLLILAMGISVALGRGLFNAVVAMIITMW